MNKGISIIIPAYNEAGAIHDTVRRVLEVCGKLARPYEIIVVDDGSTDGTGEAASRAGAKVIINPANGGYGLSLQRGIKQAQYPLIAITDADGTYPVEELPGFLRGIDKGFDMVVGARQGEVFEGSVVKSFSRKVFKWLAEYVAGQRIPDINSGLRIFRKDLALRYLPETCLGFSFTTSLTLVFMLQGHFVQYVPISYSARIGKTKVRHFRDALRTLQIMTQIILRYNPIKLFLLAASGVLLLAVLFGIAGRMADNGITVLGAWMLGAAAAVILAMGFLAESSRRG